MATAYIFALLRNAKQPPDFPSSVVIFRTQPGCSAAFRPRSPPPCRIPLPARCHRLRGTVPDIRRPTSKPRPVTVARVPQEGVEKGSQRAELGVENPSTFARTSSSPILKMYARVRIHPRHTMYFYTKQHSLSPQLIDDLHNGNPRRHRQSGRGASDIGEGHSSYRDGRDWRSGQKGMDIRTEKNGHRDGRDWTSEKGTPDTPNAIANTVKGEVRKPPSETSEVSCKKCGTFRCEMRNFRRQSSALSPHPSGTPFTEVGSIRGKAPSLLLFFAENIRQKKQA